MLRNRLKYSVFGVFCSFVFFSMSATGTENSMKSTEAPELSQRAQLGKLVFRDAELSIGRNQSCASCHAADAGFTSPFEHFNGKGSVVEGSISGRFGNIRPPTAAYLTSSPVLHHRYEDGELLFAGGAFLNGRATGKTRGNPVADQVTIPFLNPLEMGLRDSICVVKRVCEPKVAYTYGARFKDVWGSSICEIDWPEGVDAKCEVSGNRLALGKKLRPTVERVFDKVAMSLFAYLSSREVNAFSSKYDLFLKGRVGLTEQEKLGQKLFEDKGKCAACHILENGPNGEPPLFTDFTYDNLGVPRNPDNPFYKMKDFNKAGFDWVDEGLATALASDPFYKKSAGAQRGKVKVPTLRNIDRRPSPEFVKAFTHNGYFKSLKGVVHFYNTRDKKPACPKLLMSEAEAMRQKCWPKPEIEENVNKDELGDLKLTDAEEDAIVAFMKTLSDGYSPEKQPD